TTLAGSPSPSVLGQPVTFTATVMTAGGTPVTAGTVSFRRGSQLLGTASITGPGTASLTVPSLAVGTASIQAIYNGSTNDLGSISAPFRQTVKPLPTATSLTISIRRLSRGRVQYVLVASVAPGLGVALVPTGTIVFRKNGRTLGKANLSGGVA